jgi:hypothetical protein
MYLYICIDTYGRFNAPKLIVLCLRLLGPSHFVRVEHIGGGKLLRSKT